MKSNLTLLAFLIVNYIHCQNQSFQIKVNESKHIALVFDSNILSGIVSSDDYDFEFNPDGIDNLGLLKSKKKNSQESSLVVKTENGTLFNLSIIYTSSSKDLKNIIEVKDSLGFNKNKVSTQGKKNIEKQSVPAVKSLNETTPLVKASIKENDYTIGNTTINDMDSVKVDCYDCKRILRFKKNIKRIFNTNYNVKLQLNNLLYKDNKLYFVVKFINSSDLDFNINYIKSYVDTGDSSKSSSSQYLEMYPIQIFNSNRTIKGGGERVFIFVYDQFSIDNNKRLTFEVNENNGDRNIFMEVPHFIVNNPKKLR